MIQLRRGGIGNGWTVTAARRRTTWGVPSSAPGRLPRVLDIISCRGPAPAEELWGKYCFDYVLDSLFSGPPGYHGPFATNRRTGHLAVWTIGTKNDFYPDGLFACPSGGRRKGPEFVAGHSGYWWACPETAAANVNSGHIAFQRSMGDVVLGASVHGITAQSRKQFVNCSFSLSWWAPDPWPLHQALRPLKPPPEQPSEGRTSQGRETGHKGNASRQCRVFIA